jgi:hypothetical protein
MRFSVHNDSLDSLATATFRKLPAHDRKNVESMIEAVTDADLTTAIRPFSYGGKIVHELYFDPAKLLFFTRQEKRGAFVSAFIVASLARDGHMPLSSESLRTHARYILRCAQRLNCKQEARAFLRRFTTLEDEWRLDSSI